MNNNKTFYLNVPFVGEALLALDDGTRGRTIVDGAINAASVELWAGPIHLTVDQPKRLVARKWLALAAAAAFFTTPGFELEWVEVPLLVGSVFSIGHAEPCPPACVYSRLQLIDVIHTREARDTGVSCNIA